MKIICPVLLVFLVTGHLSAQEQPTPASNEMEYPSWQFGYSPLAMAVNVMKFEAYRRIGERHYVGIQGGPHIGEIDPDGSDNWPEEGMDPVRLKGFYLKLDHKVHFPSLHDDMSFYMEHGPIFYESSFPYETTGWINYVEEGVEYYREGLIRSTYTSQRLGYEVGIGMELYVDIFYFGMSFNMGFIRKISTEVPPPEFIHDNIFNGVDYEGPRLIPALRFGIALN